VFPPFVKVGWVNATLGWVTVVVGWVNATLGWVTVAVG